MTEIATTDYVMPEADAERITRRITLMAGTIREGVEKLHGLVEEAKAGNAHVALGYPSWTAYLADTLGKEPLRLDREERREIVGYLAGEQMSNRAIGTIVAADEKTIRNDLRSISSGADFSAPASAPSADSPEEVDLANVDKTTGEIHDGPVGEFVSPYTEIAEEAKKKVTGLDGKNYSRPEPSKPRRKALTDAARDAGWELRKAVERLQRIAEDDRFSRNKEEVTPHLRGHLMNAVEVCQDLLDQINSEGN